MAIAKLMRAEDLAAMEDDGQRYDLVEGKLQRMSPAGFQHGKIALRIGRLLASYVEERGLGVVVGAETGFVLARDPDTVLAPDAAFVRAERLPPEGQQRGFLEAAPDLAVEVVLPADRAGEVHDTAMRYLQAGVRLVWIVYPGQRSVAVYTPERVARLLGDGDELDGGSVVPGFRLAVSNVFA